MWIAAQQCADRLNVWVNEGERVHVTSTPIEVDTDFQTALIELIEPYLRQGAVVPVVSGGVRNGSFAQVPCAVASARQVAIPDPRIALYTIPPMSQEKPADFLQGEEAQIGGFMSQNKDWDGVLCLPSACSRWVHVNAGEVVSFSSFLTGELFGFLTQHSSLRSATQGQGWDEATFQTAVSDAMARPERVASALFSVQANAVLNRTTAAKGQAQVHGTLIGIELAAARAHWLGREVAVIGAKDLTARYASALKAQGVSASEHEGDLIALRGLAQAYAALNL
jgi:2-dehydro-3-deoxygalactonokinase